MPGASDIETQTENVIDAYAVLDGYRKLCQNNELCDFTLIAEDGRKFPVHRALLAVTSDYFRAMFSCPMVESKSEEVVLKGIMADGLEPILDYVYAAGPLDITFDTVAEIMNAANMLQFQEVFKKCVTFVSTNITEDNFLDAMKLWLTFNMETHDKISSAICNFVKTRIDDYLNGDLTVDIGAMDCSLFFHIFDNYILNMDQYDSEYYKTNNDLYKYFDLLCKWVEHGDLEGGEATNYYTDNVSDTDEDDEAEGEEEEKEDEGEDREKNTRWGPKHLPPIDPNAKFRTRQACNYISSKWNSNIPFFTFTVPELQKCLQTYLGQQPAFQKAIHQALEYHSFRMHKQVFMQNPMSRVMAEPKIIVLAKSLTKLECSRLMSKDKTLDKADYTKIWLLDSNDPRLIKEHEDGMRHYEDIPKDYPSWEPLNVSVPPGLKCITVVNINDFMMVGEKQTGMCYLFDPRKYQWETLASVQHNGEVVEDFALVSCTDEYKSSAFAIGGVINGEFTDLVLKYSFLTNAWLECGHLPEKVRDVGVHSNWRDDYCFIAGGNRLVSKEASWHTSNLNLMSDMFCKIKGSTGKIKVLPKLPHKVASAILMTDHYFDATDTSHEFIHVLGKEYFGMNPKIMEFDMDTEQWTMLQDHEVMELWRVFPRGDHEVVRDIRDWCGYICVGANDPRVFNKYIPFTGSERAKIIWHRYFIGCHWMYLKTLLPDLPSNLYARKPCSIRVPVHQK